MSLENTFGESGTSPTLTLTPVKAPEPVRLGVVDRKKPQYRRAGLCYCCGRPKTSAHHIIPRAEGGLPIFDNIAWLCLECHDAVEGPATGAHQRLEQRKNEMKKPSRPEPNVRLDTPELELPTKFHEFRDKRNRQGYLEPRDAKRYQFMLADLGRHPWDNISTWCLWNRQEFHAEALLLRGTDYSLASPELKAIIAEMPDFLTDSLPDIAGWWEPETAVVSKPVSGKDDVHVFQEPSVRLSVKPSQPLHVVTSQKENPEPLLLRFVAEHKLSFTKDKHTPTLFLGNRGAQIYQHSDSKFGLIVLSSSKQMNPSRWKAITGKCLNAGMLAYQNGDDEGSFLFDPKKAEQVACAIAIAKPRRKRELTPEQRANAIMALATGRRSQIAAEAR